MLKIYIQKFAKNFFFHLFIFSILGGIVLFGLHTYAWIPLVSLLAFTAGFVTVSDVSNEYVRKFKKEEEARILAEKDSAIWKQSLLEKTNGFPTLLAAVEEYTRLRKDEPISQFLANKRHPAQKASDAVRIEAQRRRQAEYALKNTQAIIEYYEIIAPFLLDFKNDVTGIEESFKFEEYDEEERADPVTSYLAKEEYRKLPIGERNQLALDRFWSRPKSNWLLGRMYERYIGYIQEMNGYEVEYVGIFKGYEDLGRDLICSKGDEILIIQCKYWSKFKTIYEKHIFQFFGTVFQFRDQNPKSNVRAKFYTSTHLSELAKRFAHELGIELEENCKFDSNYPSIKCNVSGLNGDKIYHLPFDQMYDTVKIEPEKGEVYCRTVAEAEKLGFRRAYRWRGTKEG